MTFIDGSGARFEVSAAIGQSLMRAAVDGNVSGILGECGGACCCATCHVYIDDASLAQAAPIGDMEKQMLDYVAAARLEASRLACQIIVTPGMDGLLVRLPPTQRNVP